MLMGSLFGVSNSSHSSTDEELKAVFDSRSASPWDDQDMRQIGMTDEFHRESVVPLEEHCHCQTCWKVIHMPVLNNRVAVKR